MSLSYVPNKTSFIIQWLVDLSRFQPIFKYRIFSLKFYFSEDILNDGKGECVICLDDLNPGDIIARLPCLCVYHKG